jgi:hypothetical protein
MTTEGFPKLFHQYYAIHETIHAILSEDGKLELSEIERRVRTAHPEVDMAPTILRAAIKQALQDQSGFRDEMTPTPRREAPGRQNPAG